MKFRNPETGEVLNVENAVNIFCGEISDCNECPLFTAVNSGDTCRSWTERYPHEAARLMGYEVVGDEPVGNSDQVKENHFRGVTKKEDETMDKPRICEVLGVEVGKWFTFDMLDYKVAENGDMKWRSDYESGFINAVALLEMINHPERIIRKPRWTEQEVDMATLLIDFRGSGSVTVGRQVNGPLWWRGENDEHGLLPREFFPSLRPGQSVTLDEIAGGAE